MSYSIRNPIKWIPNKDRTARYGIRIVPMTMKMASRWHSLVQPLIDENYFHHGEEPDLEPEDVRADKGWNWSHWLWLARGHTFSSIASRSGRAFAWCIVLDDVPDDAPPIGMLTVVPSYRSTLAGHSRDRGFAWFLSSAPGELYELLGIESARGVAQVLLDAAIQIRLDLHNDGTMFLHADPKGGEALRNYYMNARGMQLVVGTGPGLRVSAMRRFAPGEYFEMDDAVARAFCETLNHQR